MIENRTIAFLGAGPMAEAIISGLTKRNMIPPQNIYVQNRRNQQRLIELQSQYRINIDSIDIENIDIIVLAIQPKNIQQVLDSIKNKLTPKKLVISVVTSVTTQYIEDSLCKQPQVIRIMPNTSSMVGESATGLSCGKYTSKESVQLAMEIFRGIGEVYQIDEEHMDIFTGIAGSAPAYFYALMEKMEQEAINEGLSETMVRYMIAQTVYGAAKMVLEQDESFAKLIQNVAAPNGPTAAGLDSLDAFGGKKAIVEAVKATTARSKQMGNPFSMQPMKS